MSLANSDFSGAELSGADLRGAGLREARLYRSELHGADLTGSRLYQADLREADLRGANLSLADLRQADLTGARLLQADFTKADLGRADLSRTICWEVILANVDLSEVRGLDSAIHLGPSTIGIDTLIRSKGRIPDEFLRGCGVPDSLIAYVPSLLGSMEPVQFYSCFISYSTTDQAFADHLHSRMRDAKLSVWYAPEDMKGGRKVIDQLEAAIRVEDKMLLVLSEASMQSGWVETELRTALQRERKEKRQIVFPIRIASWESVRDWKCFDADTGTDLARAVREYHIPDFSRWKDHDAFEAAFARLLADLRAEVAAPTPLR